MTRPHRNPVVLFRTATAAVLVAAGLSGCTQGRWSPTGDAMASAEARSMLRTGHPTQYSMATPAAPRRRTLVLADDGYSRMTTTVSDASNTTATASVDDAE